MKGLTTLVNIKNYGINISRPNDKNTYDRYINEIAKLKPLSREEEVDLFKRIEATGDRQAIEKICRHNLLFVVSVAKRYSSMIGKTSITLEDLISEGNLGLYNAIERFDYKSGNKFISYAVWWVRQAILTSIQNNVKSIRIPVHIRSSINKIKRKEEYLEQSLGRAPSTLEIFESMLEDGDMVEIEEKSKRGDIHKREFKIDELNKISKIEISLNSRINEDETNEIGDLIKSDDLSPETQLILTERKKLVNEMLDKLPSKTKRIICCYFGLQNNDQLTLVEIADNEGISYSTVRNKIEKTIRLLRANNRKSVKFFFPHSDLLI